MSWASEVWVQWIEAVGECNEHSPSAFADKEWRKFSHYAERLERELEAVWEEHRKLRSATESTR